MTLGTQDKAHNHGTKFDLNFISTVMSCDSASEITEFSLEVLSASCSVFAGNQARFDCSSGKLVESLRTGKVNFLQTFEGLIEKDSISVSSSFGVSKEADHAKNMLRNIVLNVSRHISTKPMFLKHQKRKTHSHQSSFSPPSPPPY